LKERVSEHKRAVKNFAVNSEVASHVHENIHAIDWDQASVLAKEQQYHKRIFKEAVFSELHHSSNRTFTEVDKAWSVVLDELRDKS